MPAPRLIAVALIVALAASACTSEEAPEFGTAVIEAGEVVQTVAAPGRIDATAQAAVMAPLGGEVDALLVGDGDVVMAGDPLVQLASDTLEAQVAQAEQAVAAVDELSAMSVGAGVDLGPVLGTFRGPLDTSLPSLLDALGAQLAATEDALGAAAEGIRDTARAADELTGSVRDGLEGLDSGVVLPDALPPPPDLPEFGVPDLPELDLPDVPNLPDPPLLPELPQLPDGSGVTSALDDARASAADARAQLQVLQGSLRVASRQLADAEAQLDSQADAAEAAQAAAIAAQAEQAGLVLDATLARLDDLLVVAPIGGIVELARGSQPATGLGGLPADLSSLTQGLEAGGMGGGLAAELPEGLPEDATGDLSALLSGGGSSPSAATSDPLDEGSEVGPGQELLRVYDLSGFRAELEVDELDIVEVELGQHVVVRVDAFPGEELTGRVEYIALAPSRDIIGGALYPVTVTLDRVPEGIELRVGLTASAEIEVRRLDSDTVVPTSSLLRRGDGEVVHVVRDGIAVEVPVQIVAIGDESAAIEGEVAAGEVVVTTGVELVQDGDEVPT